MRNISAASLAAISQEQGAEPINFVGIDWTGTGNYIRYSDQTFPGVLGKILELSGLENVVNLSGNATSQSIAIKLNDTDGSVKQIMDNIDIHHKRVKVYQWFKTIPIAEAFVIFEGQISSPITWSEHERTVSFDVVSKLTDKEVGFSAEEGEFEFIPPALIGAAWPLVFGTVSLVPSLRVNEIPSGATTETIATDGTVENNSYQIIVINHIAALRKAQGQAAACLVDALNALTLAGFYRFRQQVEVVALPTNYPGSDYTSLIQQYEAQADASNDQANEYLVQAHEISLNLFEVREIGSRPSPNNPAMMPTVNGGAFPQGTVIDLLVRDRTGNYSQMQGSFDGRILNITKQITPAQEIGFESAGPLEVIEYKPTNHTIAMKYFSDVSNQKLTFIPGGSTITISAIQIYPIRYIACLNWNTIIRVWARRSFQGGFTQLLPVPNNYYTIDLEDFGTIKATMITMIRPLSSYQNEGWDDDIYVDIISPIGPNVVDIMQWLIQTYTEWGFDAASFAHVKTRQANYPSNFALLDRPNVVTLLEDIAFQSRNAIWFKEDKFFLRYLPEQTTPTEIFTDDDIEHGSMKLTCTATEDLVTRFRVTWRQDYYNNEFRAIYRHNIAKYGMYSEDYNFFIYNAAFTVEKSAVFWMIRKANIWKRITFDSFLTKMRVETYDMILLNLTTNMIADGPILAMVESVQYDSENNRMSFTVWVPIRFGEMNQYSFSLPADIDVTLIFPLPTDSGGGGGPGAGASGRLYDQSPIVGSGQSFATPARPDRGSNDRWHPFIPQRGPAISDAGDAGAQSGPNFRTFTDPSTINSQINFSTEKQKHRQWDVRDRKEPDFSFDTPGVFPGYVQQHVGGSNYRVNVYPKGIDNQPVSIVATQLAHRKDDLLPAGYPVHAVKSIISRKLDNGQFDQVTEWTINAPTWAPDLAEYPQ